MQIKEEHPEANSEVDQEEDHEVDIGDHFNDNNSSISGDEDNKDVPENNIQEIVPFIAESLIDFQPLCDLPKLFECYLCQKVWKTAGTYGMASN